MNRLQKAAVIAELADRLRENGSWCGETHLQKATYFLQDLLGVPLGVEFILYKHGPYSFDLTETLTGMRADFLLEKEFRNPGYGPALVPTEPSRRLRESYAVTVSRYRAHAQFVATKLKSKGVAELEQLATALYVTRELGDVSDTTRAARLHELKPHVDMADALAAVREFDIIKSDFMNSVIVDVNT